MLKFVEEILSELGEVHNASGAAEEKAEDDPKGEESQSFRGESPLEEQEEEGNDCEEGIIFSSGGQTAEEASPKEVGVLRFVQKQSGEK